MTTSGDDAVLDKKIAADRRWFWATQEQFDEFIRLLETPSDHSKLEALANLPSPFTRE